MPTTIGVRELKNHTSRVIRAVREEMAEYVVTLRGEPAMQFLKDAFWVKDNRIAGYSFDYEGNFSFGVGDYTDFKDMKYDPDIGIFGMDICVTLARSGLRVKRRKKAKTKIPKSHRISPKEAKNFVTSKLEVEVVGL